MASLIPRYEYDIFISYRQKDNKYDGWVTEFVEQASQDQFGLKVKLPNGNVASRLLPVKGIIKSCS
jgi:hypothetical protein